MPEETRENRILFLEFLAAKSLTAVNTHTHNLLQPGQQITFRMPSTTTSVGPWEPQLYAQIDFIFMKVGFKSIFSGVTSRTNWSCDSDHAPVTATFKGRLAFGRRRLVSPKIPKLAPPNSETGRVFSKALVDQIHDWTDWEAKATLLAQELVGLKPQEAKKHWPEQKPFPCLKNASKKKAKATQKQQN